jgi:hypothetical protein
MFERGERMEEGGRRMYPNIKVIFFLALSYFVWGQDHVKASEEKRIAVSADLAVQETAKVDDTGHQVRPVA